MNQAPHRICIVGAGMGGLAAAMLLTAAGREVVILERAEMLGGKACAMPAAHGITMLPVFQALFGAATMPPLTRQSLLARHVWSDGAMLDIVDGVPANAEAIGRFAGAAAAQGYRDFAARGQRYFEALQKPFIEAHRPGAMALSTNATMMRRLGLAALAPLWEGLAEHFTQPRLRQVFARAACCVGSSPLLAPATLMMISHIEQQGVWQVEGGVMALVEAMAAHAVAQGATIRLGAEVLDIRLRGGRVAGVALANGETLPADAVIANADAAAIAAGLLGRDAAQAVPALPANKRSFSAIIWQLKPSDMPAQSIFLPDEPTAEFTELQFRNRLAAQPSLQISGGSTAMIMAPARADTRPLPPEAVAACGQAARALAAAAGHNVEFEDDVPHTPDDFTRQYPGTGGALYGQAAHGWAASFARPVAGTKLPGFYLCGGGTHPGAGVAMAAISGRLAAERVLEDRP
jgi:1-hydroxycarotenoid 3,4-desaturase